MEAEVVIGANYGDEGKGLITDYLAALGNANTLVVRFNGGAQAGHTVQRPGGLRHVFSHFASGTFAGAETYLSDFYIVNPVLFTQELAKLQSRNFFPKVICHPEAVVTTPYDMFINQTFENSLGKNRHGSCGVGIGETIERNLHSKFQLAVKDLFNQEKLKAKLLAIRDEWLELRLGQLMQRKLTRDESSLICSNEIFEYFLHDINSFLANCDVADYHYFGKSERLIFEGAQGLLLDQGHMSFPHVTRSNTGLQNVSTIANHAKIHHLNVHYVTRCYLTRHGIGPLPNERPFCPCPQFKDETNIPHKFQGSLRFAPLEVAKLNSEISADLNKLSNNITKKVTLAVTCLDQFEEKITVAKEVDGLVELNKEEFIRHVFENTHFDNYILSYGPTREDCKNGKI
ncbi:MAG: adenylosuccinate synthetase [Gammaproteobacteria bacterium]|nr:adenylosuccinate synthetase [Gammaproteobacteria bacterium]